MSFLPVKRYELAGALLVRPALGLVFLVVSAQAGPQIARAQSFDPQSESPLSLLEVPADGVAYYEAGLRARALLAEERYAEAEPLAERLTREYPRDGENWMLLGHVKRGVGKHAEAAAAFERAGAILGWDIGPLGAGAGINAALSHLAAGNHRQALDLIRLQVFEHHTMWRFVLARWEAFAPLREFPEFREVAGLPDTAGWTRDEGWRRDVDYLYDEVKRLNPDYRDEPFPAEFERRYRELRASVPRLSDEEIFIGMGRMLAVLRQGHVELFPPAGDRYLPVSVYAFPEGVFVIDASEGHEGLIGSRVVAVGGAPVEELLRRLTEARSRDGDMEVLWHTAGLASTYRLKGLGAAASADSVALTVRPPGGPSRTVALATLPAPLAPRIDRLVAPPGVAPPLFLRNVGRELQQLHWEHPLPEHDALYIQMNQVQNDSDETLPEFGLRLRALLAETRPKNVILDMRHNNGGAPFAWNEFVRTLIGYSTIPGNRLYVLIGRRTYSASAIIITHLERFADPVFVGEASSECCNFYGPAASVTLPFTQIPGELAGLKMNVSHPWDERREMSPDVPVQLTAEDYFAGRDPVLEAVFRLIEMGVDR